MSSGSWITTVRTRPPIPVIPPSGEDKEIYGPCSFGVLTREDKRMLEEYSGLTFDFPPRSGQAVPAELCYVAQARGAEYRDGLRFSDLGSLLAQVQRTYRALSGEDVISADLLAYVGRHSSPASTAPSFEERMRAHLA